MTVVAFIEPSQTEVIDGTSVLGLLTGETKETPVAARFYYCDTHLQAVRSGQWKLIFV